MRDTQQIYLRQLPGGGFVAIEVAPSRGLFGRRKFGGDVIVERRLDVARRAGHAPPAVAHAEADSIAGVFHELFPIAHSNSAIASRCLARAGRGTPELMFALSV